MKRIIQFIFIALVLLPTFSCNKSDDNRIPGGNDGIMMCDMVTFVGNPLSNNNNSVFQFQKENDSRLTTLRATDIALDTSVVKVNTRMLLFYTPETGMHNIDDNVSVTGIKNVFNDSIRTGKTSLMPPLEHNPIFVNSIWRSGTYINIHCGLTYVFEPYSFVLMVDKNTIDNELPDVYLSYKASNDHGSRFQEFYASIDVANLWNRPTCKGFTLHVNDSNFGKNEIEFKKLSITPAPPMQ